MMVRYFQDRDDECIIVKVVDEGKKTDVTVWSYVEEGWIHHEIADEVFIDVYNRRELSREEAEEEIRYYSEGEE